MTITFNQRTETYLSEIRYNKPKQVFQVLADVLEQSGFGNTEAKFLDVGCATGEMIYYLKQRFPKFLFTGIDSQLSLLNQAKCNESIRQCAFVEADALHYRDKSQDIVTCFGMLGIFDQFEPLLENLVANTRQGGRIYIHGLFNDVDIDVRVYYKDHQNNKDWNRGFNIFSTMQLSNWLKPRASSWRFIPFLLDVDIPRRSDTPHRAYTAKLEDGKRITVNGLCLMLPEMILEITV